MATDIEIFASKECQIDVTIDAFSHIVRATHLKSGIFKMKSEPKRHALFKLRQSVLAELYEAVQRKGENK